MASDDCVRSRGRPQQLCVLLLILSLALKPSQQAGICDCSGHGVCDSNTATCTCNNGWTGASCSLRTCPQGTAWFDYASATDTAHALAECSNMGVCNRQTGICECNSNFEGHACERMKCPSCSNGRCMSMREAAEYEDDLQLHLASSYTNNWDADKIYGCVCDPGYTGYDCSKRICPKGDDPMTTGQVDEIQHISCLCNGCSGSIKLRFRGDVTDAISYNADAATIKEELEALSTISQVTVSISNGGTELCDSDGSVVSITFTHNSGDLPDLKVINNLSGGTSAVATQTDGTAGLYDGVGASVAGTKEDAECSNRGTCDTSTGVCTCMSGFASSDGAGSAGNLGDCGYGTTSSCPVDASSNICSGHGTCSGASEYTCTCYTGWTGYDCSKMTCPVGPAWFDEASTADSAHANAECSNMGACDRSSGTCTCRDGFEGSSCRLLSCPDSCSSQGSCKTMQALALLATDSYGDLRGVTYGDSATDATWDFQSVRGCHCDQGYYMGPYAGAFGGFLGYDCSLRSCPYGDDPETAGGVNEQQQISCTADGGTFTLTFRGVTTSAIAFDATAEEVKTALEALSKITSVSVSFSSGVAACSSSGVVTTVEFTYEFGDLPDLVPSSTLLTNGAGAVSLSVTESTQGTKESAECSNRGICDRTTGQCDCFNYYLSSDGDGNLGTRGDCGYKSPYPTKSTS